MALDKLPHHPDTATDRHQRVQTVLNLMSEVHIFYIPNVNMLKLHNFIVEIITNAVPNEFEIIKIYLEREFLILNERLKIRCQKFGVNSRTELHTSIITSMEILAQHEKIGTPIRPELIDEIYQNILQLEQILKNPNVGYNHEWYGYEDEKILIEIYQIRFDEFYKNNINTPMDLD